MHTILLAGANGIIGSYLYEHLKNDYDLIGISRKKNSNHRINVDLNNKYILESKLQKIKKPDCLIFLIGRAHKKGRKDEILKYESTNYKTLNNLLSVLKKQKKIPDKIIFASTISVYGEKYKTSLYTEESLTNPRSPYAVTKLKAEKYLSDRFPNESWILRFSPVYSSNFMLNINRRTKLNQKFYFKIGDGSSKFSLCNTENILLVVKNILNGAVPSGIYNISDPFNYTYDYILKYYNSKRTIRIPTFIIKIIYFFGKNLGNAYLIENSIKLLTDNIYPSKKISQFVNLIKYLK